MTIVCPLPAAVACAPAGTVETAINAAQIPTALRTRDIALLFVIVVNSHGRTWPAARGVARAQTEMDSAKDVSEQVSGVSGRANGETPTSRRLGSSNSIASLGHCGRDKRDPDSPQNAGRCFTTRCIERIVTRIAGLSRATSSRCSGSRAPSIPCRPFTNGLRSSSNACPCRIPNRRLAASPNPFGAISAGHNRCLPAMCT